MFSGLVSATTVPAIIKFGLKKKLVDFPNERKKHNKPIVRIGGLAIGLSLLLSIILALALNWIDPISWHLIKVCLTGSIFLLILGLVDDIFTVSPIFRLTFQIIFSILIWQLGIKFTIIDFTWISDNFYFIIPNILSLILTTIWICGIINAFNWLDGLDGLAAGTCVVASFGFTSIILASNNDPVTFLMAGLIGSCMGFLLYNFYSAKIYMGDCGSYFIGFLISVFSIYMSYSQTSSFKELGSSNFTLPIFILLLPIADMLYVIIKRIRSKRSPFIADRSHFHHRLLRAGFNHKDSVLFGYIVNQYFVAIALMIYFDQLRIPIFIISNLLFLTFVYKKCSIKISNSSKIYFAAKYKN